MAELCIKMSKNISSIVWMHSTVAVSLGPVFHAEI